MSNTNRRYASDDLWSRGGSPGAGRRSGKKSGYVPVTSLNTRNGAARQPGYTAAGDMWSRGGSTPQHPTVSASDKLWQRGGNPPAEAGRQLHEMQQEAREEELKKFLEAYGEYGQAQRSKAAASDSMERRGAAAATPKARSAAAADSTAWQIDDSRRRLEEGGSLMREILSGNLDSAEKERVAGELEEERKRKQALIDTYDKNVGNYQALRNDALEKARQELDDLQLQLKTARDIAENARGNFSESSTEEMRSAWKQTLQEAQNKIDMLEEQIAYKSGRLGQLENNDEAGRLQGRQYEKRDPLEPFRNDPAFKRAAEIYEYELSDDTKKLLDQLWRLEEAQRLDITDPSVVFPYEGFASKPKDDAVLTPLEQLEFALALEADLSPFDRDQLKEMARRMSRQKMMDGAKEFAGENPLAALFLSGAISPAEAVLGGLGVADQAIDDLYNRFKAPYARVESDPNAGLMELTAARSALNSGIADAIRNNYGEGWATAYQIGSEILETGLAAMAGPDASKLEKLGSISESYYDFRQRGVSQEKSLLGSFGSMAVGALIQALPGMIQGNASPLQDSGSTLWSKASAGITEALGQETIDRMTAGVNSRYNKRIQKYREQGISVGRARANAKQDIWNELFLNVMIALAPGN